MNAQKIQNNTRNQKKLIDRRITFCFHVCQLQLLHSLLCFRSRGRPETHAPISISIHFQDHIKLLPFEDNSFDVVFANLSIHYFDCNTTMQLSDEIWRILKSGGLFMGSVNSSAAYEFIKDRVILLEENYYLSGERRVRLFDRPQFDYFFGQFTMLSLEEIHTVRFHNPRDHWEFILRKGIEHEGNM